MDEENAPKRVLARVIAIGQLLATAQKPAKRPVVSGPGRPNRKRSPQTATPNTPLQ
jgi:hypothetical protein